MFENTMCLKITLFEELCCEVIIMKKRRLPIPLILLIPIVLLVVVAAAGLYRFSLSDEEIRAKFPQPTPTQDALMQQVFGIATPNPWTIKVPETTAYSLLTRRHDARAIGQYQDGEVRGDIWVDTHQLIELGEGRYAAPLIVSNQGSGLFYYLALFEYDSARQRMISRDALLLGDRIVVEAVDRNQDVIAVTLRTREEDQPMSEEPKVTRTIMMTVTEQNSWAIRP